MRLDEDCCQDCGGGGPCQRCGSAIDRVWNRRRDTVARLSLATLRTIAEALEADPAVKEGGR